jgi:dTMP kinase
MSRFRFTGRGLPLSTSELKGHLIVVEGTDGVGRSTQIRLLREWLEIQGYAVAETGWTRSKLIGQTITNAKEVHSLNKWTFALLYATDFADRLENEIIPALRAGYVVLADRYIYTAMARALVRGHDRGWLENLFGIALVPDLVFYLRINVDTLTSRVLELGALDYYEAGMDIYPGLDLYDSFRKYQSRLLKEFDRLARQYGFIVVDARKSVVKTQSILRERIGELLAAGAETSTGGSGGEEEYGSVPEEPALERP